MWCTTYSMPAAKEMAEFWAYISIDKQSACPLVLPKQVRLKTILYFLVGYKESDSEGKAHVLLNHAASDVLLSLKYSLTSQSFNGTSILLVEKLGSIRPSSYNVMQSNLTAAAAVGRTDATRRSCETAMTIRPNAIFRPECDRVISHLLPLGVLKTVIPTC